MPPHLEVMEIYWWELLAICHHPEMSCNHNHSDSGDIVFLIYHVTFGKTIFK